MLEHELDFCLVGLRWRPTLHVVLFVSIFGSFCGLVVEVMGSAMEMWRMNGVLVMGKKWKNIVVLLLIQFIENYRTANNTIIANWECNQQLF